MFAIDQLVADCRRASPRTSPRSRCATYSNGRLRHPPRGRGVRRRGRAGSTSSTVARSHGAACGVGAAACGCIPHNHQMWAAIGIYGGQEDNTFYRRDPDDRRSLIESGGKQLREQRRRGPRRRHDPRGDEPDRSAHRRDPRVRRRFRERAAQPVAAGDAGTEEPWSMDHARRQFAEANAALE